MDQQDLPADRLWDVLAVLDMSGTLESYPGLLELWEEFNETIEGEGSIEELASQIEGDPEGIWLALQGLSAVEPEVRIQILLELSERTIGPNLLEFFRLVAYCEDPATRKAAIGVLEAALEVPGVARVWTDLAAHHHDNVVASTARRKLEVISGTPSGFMRLGTESSALMRSAPRIVRSVVTAVDGQGRAMIGLVASTSGRLASAFFACDTDKGVLEVRGNIEAEADGPLHAYQAFVDAFEGDLAENDHALALALLSGCLTLNGPATPPAFRYWLEQTAGSDFRPRPFRASFPDGETPEIPFDEMSARTAAVLARCPDWLDDSPLTREFAEEILLREKDGPDPRRDGGAYRFFFEHRLVHRLESYRRTLLWMAWLWRSRGESELASSALVLAYQLSDAQHVVPGHPFAVQITTRSLAAAQAITARRDAGLD